MSKKDKLQIVKVNTGETKDIQKATSIEISEFLTDINYKRRQLDRLEKAIKKYVIGERELKFENGITLFGNHKVIETGRMYFDKKRFEKKGTKKEKEIVKKAKAIQEKYQTRTVFTKWV